MGSRKQPAPSDIRRYLREIDFPVNRDELVEHARSKNAPDDVVASLERLEERAYESPGEVSNSAARSHD